MDITIAESAHDTTTELVLDGRFDAHESDMFRASVEEALEHDQTNIRVNLANVEFVDSTALAELVRGMKRCREQRGDLVLVSPSDPVRVILELTKLNAAFDIV